MLEKTFFFSEQNITYCLFIIKQNRIWNLISLALDSGNQRFFLFIIIIINLITLIRLHCSLAAQNRKWTYLLTYLPDLFILTEMTL